MKGTTIYISHEVQYQVALNTHEAFSVASLVGRAGFAAMNGDAPKPLPPEVEGQLSGMQHVQQQRVLLRVNHIADSCFRQCITDFSLTKQLASSEEECLRRCVSKYVLLSSIAGGSFAEYLGSDKHYREWKE
jgi:hypothetical protein